MSGGQVFVTVIILAAATALIRFLPFLLFPAGKEIPKTVLYLGKVLPAAVMGMLVVYCLKDVSLFSGARGVPELLAGAFVVITYLKRRSLLLSIGGGTALYMALVQVVVGSFFA